MALTSLEKVTVQRGFAAARKLVDDVYPIIKELNVIYDSTGGAKTSITQANLDAETTFGAITKQQLDDGFFAMTSTMKAAIEAAYTQLAQLAARSS